MTSCMMLHSGPGHVTVSSEKFSLTSVISISHPVKFLLASSIIRSILLCIASNILAIRITNKKCSYWYNLPFFFSSVCWQKHLVWMQLSWCKNKSFLWTNPICRKEPSCPGKLCCSLVYWVLYCYCCGELHSSVSGSPPLKGGDNSRSRTTSSQVVKKSIFLTWNMDRTFCIWCVRILW